MKDQFNNRAQGMLPGLAAAGLTLLIGWSMPAMAAAPQVPVSQVPLTIAIPAHPQIVLAVANSESMDGNLSGAILAGSGSLGANYAALQNSSSPLNYTIPTGFTPPLSAGNGGTAPYTVQQSGGNLADNSPSRLNVAKAGIAAILNSYMTSADFALLDYSVGGFGVYQTWVYQMSPPGGFTFTNTASTTTEQVANPCYGVSLTANNPVSTACSALNNYGPYATQNITAQKYMNVSASSDDPAINDVLYAGGLSAVCIAYGGVNPANPFPPNFTLAQFNSGGVLETYNQTLNACAPQTGPTNAGFVPYSSEVMYIQRGFGYYGGASSTGGTVLVPMTSAGATPTSTSVANAIGLFTPYLAPETNSTGTTEIKALAVQSPTAGLLAQAKSYFSTNPPSSNGCTAQQYVVLLTDGLPTQDLSGHSWPPLGSAAAAGYGVTATFNADGSLNTTNDQALTDTIANLKALKTAGIATYIVGLGAGVNPSLNPVAASTLTAMAVAGGTGSYFAATDPVTLTNDLQSILGKILANTQSVASIAVNSTGLSTNSVVYQSQFLSSDANQDWTGNLYAFNVNATTGVVDTLPSDAVWTAATQLDAQNWNTGRKIATWDPVAKAGIPFRWTSGTTATTGIASSTTLGAQLSTFAADTNGSDVLNYLRGSRTQELANGGKFRNRTHVLGDIVFSNPIYVGPPAANNLSSSYLSFAAAKAARPPVIYVGADDGMLHAFDAATGNERFAYIPTGVYAKVVNLVSPYYNAQHLFYVDGSPRNFDVYFDSSWHTLLLGVEGAGGNSIFALDVTDPSTLTSESALASAVKWDFTDTDMGLGFSNPVVALTNSTSTPGGLMVFTGNGVDSANQKPFLYALNPQTGAIVAKVDLCAQVTTACNLSASNGLSSPTAVNSSGQAASAADVVYAGDLQGNLWRVDISNSDPTKWTASVLLQARDASNKAQPITTAPVATLNPRYPQLAGSLVFVGTGQLLGIPDLSSTQAQTIYGVYDPATPYSSPITRSSMVQQVLSSATIGSQSVAVVTGNAVSIPTTKGWYIDLTLTSGERVINTPVLRSGALVVTSTQPAASSCSSGGSSFSYIINYSTGSAFPTPQFDANHDGSVDSGDKVTNANGTKSVPIGMSLGTGFYANATLVNTGTNQSCTGCAPPGYYWKYNCPESGATCQPTLQKGPPKNRIAWWEVHQ